MNQSNSFVGIDPGNGGGIAVLTEEEDNLEVISRKFPTDVRDVGMFLKAATSNTNHRVAIEKVHSMPNQGVKSTFTFGMNYGIWIGALRTLDIDFIKIQAKQWQAFYEIPTRMNYYDRKKELKRRAIELFPNERVTMYTADALLIANYCMQTHYSKIKDK
jgi:Holliday junction resolvasome RuvABC endonuclease subunit